jgi:hypothetical protein
MVAPVPSQTRITTPYGQKGSSWSSGYHTGCDFAAPAGRNVVAARPGIVEIKPQGWAGPNMVIVNVGGGQKDIYAHMRSKTVSAGQRVQAGQKLGEVGTLGNSTGNHLHFEVQINGRSVNPAGAIKWREGMVLPPPPEEDGSASGSTGSSSGSGSAGSSEAAGNFDAVRDLIDIQHLRRQTVFNPPLWDNLRQARMYNAQLKEGQGSQDWWSGIHGPEAFGKGWITRDPAALESVAGLPEHDHYEGPIDPETGEVEEFAPSTIRTEVIHVDNYRPSAGPLYGFRFLFNPGTNSENYATPSGVDTGQYLADVAAADAPPVVQNTGSSMTLNLLLDRQMDHKMFSLYGINDRARTQKFYEAIGIQGWNEDDYEGLLKYGTMWDLEYLFRCVNGQPPGATMWHGRKTSDFGVLVPYPVLVSIGDGPKVRRIRGSIMQASFHHTMFAPGMIPIRTQVSLGISRHSDSWYTNESTEGESKDDSAAGSSGSVTVPGVEGPAGGVHIPAPTPDNVPGYGSSKPGSRRDQNIAIAKPIFDTYRSKYGWNDADWTALIKLWDGESSWNHLAKNPSSNATGIPQAIPRWHPETNNDAWRKTPAKQIAWGLEYIRVKSRESNKGTPYGRPSRAYSTWLSRKPHWY